MVDNSIHNIVMDGVLAHLIQKLQIEVTGDSIAGLVKTGKLQDDPTATRINILIAPGDATWRHVLDTGINRSDGRAGFVYEIGGDYPTQAWRRRYIVEMSFYFDGELIRDTARRTAQIVYSRAQDALSKLKAINFAADTFGEKVWSFQVSDTWIRESGGEGEFIWKGEIRFEALTVIEPKDV